MEEKRSGKQILREYALMTAATLAMAAGIYFFKFPNNFVMGGVSGLSMVLGRVQTAVSPATVMLIINAALLVVGLAVFGRRFGVKTIYCSLLLSLALEGLEFLVPMSAPSPQTGFRNPLPMMSLVLEITTKAPGSIWRM